MSSSLLSFFSQDLLLQIARKTGFVSREPRKITPLSFLGSSLLALNSGSPHLRFQSLFAGLLSHTVLSKQALHKRMGEASCRFMQGVLAYLFSHQIGAQNLSPRFNRILLADSTCLSLPKSHRDLFPGPSNAKKSSACLRIQAVFELLSEQFLDFKIAPFTRNDQAACDEILPLLKSGDLVLRDLGYFSLHVFEKMDRLKAFFLSRWRYGTTLLDPKTQKPVDLLGLLQKKGSLDIPLLLGKEHSLQVRLVAIPLPAKAVEIKRRKAYQKQKKDRRLNPSKDFMALLSWNIFITNANSTLLPLEHVPKIYSLRWRVETLFKSWKSHMNLKGLEKVGKNQIKTLICAHLILTLLLHQSIPNDPSFSILKLAQLFTYVFPMILLAFLSPSSLSQLLVPHINRHCSYEKRRRKNFQTHKKESLS